jgi:hypothetical protein
VIVKTLVERLYRAADQMDKLGNHALAHELRGTHVRAVGSAVDALANAERVAANAKREAQFLSTWDTPGDPTGSS